MECIGGRDRLDAQAEAVEVVIADRTRRAPGGELAERPQFRYPCGDRMAIGSGQSNVAADIKRAECILAQGEAEPAVPLGLQRHHRLAGNEDLAGLGDLDADGAIRRADQPQLAEFGFEGGKARRGQRHLGFRQIALLFGRPGRGFLMVGTLQPKPRFTLFLSRNDGALSLSRRFAGDKDRLGMIDPDKEPYRSKLDHSNIVVIDLTKLASNDPYNHGKFAESPEVVRLIGARLIDGQPISGADVSMGERIISPMMGSRATASRE